MSVATVLTSLLLLTTSPWLPSSVTSTIIPDESQSSTMTCNTCCQGPGGIPGIPGAAGVPGAAGFPGAPGGFGPQGLAGPKGDIGVPGLSVKGQKGNVGEAGRPGPRGELSLRGAPGKVGPMGIQGPRGEDGLNGEVGNQGPKGQKGESEEASFAGFTVAKTQSQSGTGIVTFDTVISDVAGDYDTNTHKFTCSVPGYYLFMFTIGSRDNNNPYVRLYHNGNDIVEVYTRPSGTATTNDHNMGSNSALILLTAGDQVWLRNDHGVEIYAASSVKMTTFTGVLFHAV